MYVSLIDHLSRGGHNNLIPVVWQKIENIEHLDEDVRPLMYNSVARCDYESAFTILHCSLQKQTSRIANLYKYIEMRLFNMLLFVQKVSDNQSHFYRMFTLRMVL